MMTRLNGALQQLGLDGEVALAGRWVTLRGERCLVYVVETGQGADFYTWCDDPQARTVEHYHDPVTAIQAGLHRAAHHNSESNGGKLE
jgi:hypothetical protein